MPRRLGAALHIATLAAIGCDPLPFVSAARAAAFVSLTPPVVRRGGSGTRQGLAAWKGPLIGLNAILGRQQNAPATIPSLNPLRSIAVRTSGGLFTTEGASFTSAVSLKAKSQKAKPAQSFEDDMSMDYQERNELLIEAYASVVDVARNGTPVVEVALDVPAAWWTEIVLPRIERIADSAGLAPGKSALDVGVGTGTLLKALCAAGRANENDVVGIDLCKEMLDLAEINCPNAAFVEGDFFDATLADLQPGDGGDCIVNVEGDEAAKATPPKLFDAIFFNAVFGSLHDQYAALSKAAELCVRGGKVVISHPMGSQFVKSLHEQDSVFTPNILPSTEALQRLLKFLPFFMKKELLDEEEFYLAVLERAPHSVMEKTLFMRGPIASGYGRGGKKLGVPTANLPESLFNDALAKIPTGVYCGWATVDGPDGVSSEAVKAVVNIGYSPTFVGEENREKIAEAHLLKEFTEDFYGKEMRLILAGHQRPEVRFGSFPELMAAIKQDIADAGAALDTPQLSVLALHPFLRKDSGLVPWMESDYDMAMQAAKI